MVVCQATQVDKNANVALYMKLPDAIIDNEATRANVNGVKCDGTCDLTFWATSFVTDRGAGQDGQRDCGTPCVSFGG